MKYMLLTLFVMIFVSTAAAQSTKTPARPLKMKTEAGRQLDETNEKIRVVEKEVAEAEADLDALRQKYSDDYPKVKEFRDLLSKQMEHLGQLYVIRDGLERQIRLENIPTNQTELLRLLVWQNEEIIELLKAIKRNTEN